MEFNFSPEFITVDVHAAAVVAANAAWDEWRLDELVIDFV